MNIFVPPPLVSMRPPVSGGGGVNELADHLIAWWEMEEADGANRTDSTGNGHTLTQHGGVLQSGTAKNGTWSAETGNSKYLDNNDAAFKGTTGSIAGWVNGLGNDAGWIVSRYAGGGGIAWYIYGIGNHLVLFVRNSADSAEYQAVSTVNVTAAGFHHVAVGFTGTTAWIQVDNEARVSVTTDGIRSVSTALTFADLAGGTGSATPMKMDAWGFWDVSLSTASVTDLQTKFYPF